MAASPSIRVLAVEGIEVSETGTMMARNFGRVGNGQRLRRVKSF
jgi:hypothetical protein